MPFALWFVVAGLLLTLMALGKTTLSRLPLSTAQLYLLVGLGIGPLGIGLLALQALVQAVRAITVIAGRAPADR